MFSFRKSQYQTSKQKCETNNELPHERFYAFYQIIKWLWFRSSHATGVLENFISNCERLFSHLYRESSNNSWRFLHFRIVGLFFPHFFFFVVVVIFWKRTGYYERTEIRWYWCKWVLFRLKELRLLNCQKNHFSSDLKKIKASCRERQKMIFL